MLYVFLLFCSFIRYTRSTCISVCSEVYSLIATLESTNETNISCWTKIARRERLTVERLFRSSVPSFVCLTGEKMRFCTRDILRRRLYVANINRHSTWFSVEGEITFKSSITQWDQSYPYKMFFIRVKDTSGDIPVVFFDRQVDR